MISKKKTDSAQTKQNDQPKSGFNPDDVIESVKTQEEESKQEGADSQEFDSLLRKYHKISRDIRMSALIEEKKELEKMIKSPARRYYEGSREDRLQALEEEKELMEKLKDISKKKPSNL